MAPSGSPSMCCLRWIAGCMRGCSKEAGSRTIGIKGTERRPTGKGDVMEMSSVEVTGIFRDGLWTLLDRNGECIATVKAANLGGQPNPEAEVDAYKKNREMRDAKRQDELKSFEWREKCRELAWDRGAKYDYCMLGEWEKKFQSMTRSWRSRAPRAPREIKLKTFQTFTWDAACKRMLQRHSKLVVYHAHPGMNWKEWAVNVASNLRKRRDLKRCRQKLQAKQSIS